MRLTPENTSRFVQAGPVKIHYHEAGEGPVLLCIHGGAPGAFGWSNFGRNLEALSHNFRTLIVDLPGYGKSDKPAIDGVRTGAYAQCFKDMLAVLNIEKAHILGIATGGSVAIKMALESPGIVDKLVLINCPGGLSLFQQKSTPATHSYYQGEGPSMERMRASMERLVFDKRCITDEMVRERYEASIAPEFMDQAPEGKGGKPGENLEVLWPELHRIEAQTLIIWGRDNPTLNYDNSLFMLNRIKNSRVHIHSQCGLLVPVEKPEEFNLEVTGFLSLK